MQDGLPNDDRIKAAKDKLREQTRGLPGVHGWGSDGSMLRVYLQDGQKREGIPNQVDGIPVVIVATGKIRALTK